MNDQTTPRPDTVGRSQEAIRVSQSMPINTPMKPQWQLTITSGLHRGAIAQLPIGETLLGSGDDCDLLLADATIDSHHLRFVTTESDATLTTVTTPFRLADGRHSYQSLRITDSQTIVIGSVTLLIAPLGTPNAKRQKRFGNSNPNRADTAEGYRLGWIQSRGRGLAERQSLRATIVTTLALIATAASVANTSALETRGSLAPSSLTARMPQQPVVSLRPATSSAPAVQHPSSADEGRLLAADQILRELDCFAIRAVSIEGDRLVLAGYRAPRIHWSTVTSILVDDIDGIEGIDDTQVATLAERTGVLQDLLAEANLTHKVRLNPRDEWIEVAGALNRTDKAIWETIESQFKQDFGASPPLRININQKPDIKLNIRAVSVGSPPFITTQDGTRYMLGSRLVGDYVIQAIESDRLILANAESSLVYALGAKQ